MKTANKTVKTSTSSVTISVGFTPAEAKLLRALAQADHGGDVAAYVRSNMKSIAEADIDTFNKEARLAFA